MEKAFNKVRDLYVKHQQNWDNAEPVVVDEEATDDYSDDYDESENSNLDYDEDNDDI